MFSGQHREVAVKVRIDQPGAVGSQPLASVRLFFRDAAEQGLSRVQEVVARYEVTDQPSIVAQHENDRAKAIAAVHEAAEVAIAAAQDVSAGRFDAADETFARDLGARFGFQDIDNPGNGSDSTKTRGFDINLGVTGGGVFNLGILNPSSNLDLELSALQAEGRGEVGRAGHIVVEHDLRLAGLEPVEALQTVRVPVRRR